MQTTGKSAPSCSKCIIFRRQIMFFETLFLLGIKHDVKSQDLDYKSVQFESSLDIFLADRLCYPL